MAKIFISQQARYKYYLVVTLNLYAGFKIIIHNNDSASLAALPLHGARVPLEVLLQVAPQGLVLHRCEAAPWKHGVVFKRVLKF